MNVSLFFSLITCLSLGSLWLGWRSRSKTKTNEDYFLMGRKMGLFALVMTLLATQIGGGALMGSAEEAYVHGWKVIVYPLGMVLGFIVLGLGYGAKIRSLNLTTIPEIFERIYHSPLLRQAASLLSIASLFCVLVGQGIAARKFFISLGFGGDLLFVFFWLVLVFYTVLGGLRAVVKTDIIQTGFVLIAFAIVIGVSVSHSQPSLEAIDLSGMTKGKMPWVTWLLMPFLFSLIGQDMGQRCFAAKKPPIVSKASFIAAGILLIVSLVPIYLGRLAGQYGLIVPEGSSVLIMAVKVFTNPTIATLAICAILAAIISTADSLLCSISSNISFDFSHLKTSVTTSKIITFLVGMVTLGVSFLFDNVLSVFMFSYELAVSVLLVPVTLGIWMKQPKKRSAILAMLLGFLCFLIFRKWALPVKELVTLTAAFSIFMVSEYVEKYKKIEEKV